MTAFEVILLLCGIVCVVVSYVMGDSGRETRSKDVITSKLTEEQKADIRRQINEIVEEEVQNASEKTEVSLDKISNTKILEMNEYAENVLGQINRNHNETVFLYDMLNDKAKEVKTTVKDINATRHQVERIQAEVAAIDNSMKAADPDVQRTEGGDNSPAGALPVQTPAAPKSDKPVKKTASDKTKKTADDVRADGAPAAADTDRAGAEKPKNKEFKIMTPDIVKEVRDEEPEVKSDKPKTVSKTAAKKPRQTARKTTASSQTGKTAEGNKSGAEEQAPPASGNVAKERLRRVVAKDTENIEKEKDLTEEDRMDAAILKAGGTEDKPAKAKSTARKSSKKTQAAKAEPPKEAADMNIQFESGANNNEIILKMYKSGKNNKEIAKELNLGVGEVKLVIDLYNSTK